MQRGCGGTGGIGEARATGSRPPAVALRPGGAGTASPGAVSAGGGAGGAAASRGGDARPAARGARGCTGRGVPAVARVLSIRGSAR